MLKIPSPEDETAGRVKIFNAARFEELLEAYVHFHVVCAVCAVSLSDAARRRSSTGGKPRLGGSSAGRAHGRDDGPRRLSITAEDVEENKRVRPRSRVSLPIMLAMPCSSFMTRTRLRQDIMHERQRIALEAMAEFRKRSSEAVHEARLRAAERREAEFKRGAATVSDGRELAAHLGRALDRVDAERAARAREMSDKWHAEVYEPIADAVRRTVDARVRVAARCAFIV